MSDSDSETAESVFVENGKIISVGTKKDIFKLKKTETRTINLKGQTMLPGFIAVHTHPDLSAYLHGFVDLSGFTNKSPDEVWGRLKATVKKAKKGEWIFCKGFDPMLVKGLKSPGINQLDKIAPDNPLFIISQSLHSAWANSLAFHETGITEKTPDPAPGSYYEKDKSGKLTGFISEIEAIKKFSKVAIKVFDIKNNITKVFNEYAKSGFTSITTMGMFATDSKPFMLYKHLSSASPGFLSKVLEFSGIFPKKKPTVRHFVYIKHDTPFLIPDSVDNGDDFFKVVGIKLWYDGSPYTGSMYLNKPYLNSDLMINGLNVPYNHHGESVVSKNDFFETIKKFHEKGWQLSIHSQGDRSTADVLEEMEKVIVQSKIKDSRHRIEHGLLLPPELLGKVKDLRMTISYHINHLYYYGTSLKNDIIGNERAEKMLPVKSTINNNIPFSLHADAPMYPEKPFSLIRTAVERKTREGNVIGNHEKISVMEALKAITIHAAWQLNMEKKIGSIEPGKYADFVIVDKNPLKVSIEELKKIEVISTIVNGIEI